MLYVRSFGVGEEVKNRIIYKRNGVWDCNYKYDYIELYDSDLDKSIKFTIEDFVSYCKGKEVFGTQWYFVDTLYVFRFDEIDIKLFNYIDNIKLLPGDVKLVSLGSLVLSENVVTPFTELFKNIACFNKNTVTTSPIKSGNFVAIIEINNMDEFKGILPKYLFMNSTR